MTTPEEIMLQVMTYGLASNGFDGNKWTQCEDGQCSWTEDHWKPAVQSVLDSLDEAGYVIVPSWVRDFLAMIMDDDECSLDHHGYCQTHWLEEDCSMPKIRALLAAQTQKGQPPG